MVRTVFEPLSRRFVAILVLDEALATPSRSGHFIQNSSKLDYLLPLLVVLVLLVVVLVLVLVFKR